MGTVLISLGPRLTTAIILLLGLASILHGATRSAILSLIRPGVTIAVAALLAGYLLANAGWAVDPASAYRKVAGLFLIGACSVCAVLAVRSMDDATLERVFRAFLIAIAIGAIALLIELTSGLRVTRAIYNVMPFLRPDGAKHLGLDGERVIYIGTYILNRNVGLIALLFWPVLALLSIVWRTETARWFSVGLVVLLVAVIAASQHESSQLALAFGVVVAGLAFFASRAIRWLLAILWCASFLLVVPLSKVAYDDLELHKADWLPYTAQARIIIWGYTAKSIPDNLLHGVGVRSTRLLDTAAKEKADKPDGHVVAPRTGRHAHNLYLQSWFELGLIGVILVVLAGLRLLALIDARAGRLRPFGYGLFAAWMVIAAFAWGMWQTWLIAAYGIVVVVFALACTANERNSIFKSRKTAGI